MENIQTGNNMEQEQQPSYEELVQEYSRLANQNRQMELALQQMQVDKTNEQVKILLDIINSDKVSKKLTKLAEWHVQRLLAKPKKVKLFAI